MQPAAGDDEQQQLRDADAAELEFSLCLRLKNQPAAAQDEQQEPAAQLQQRALFGGKLGAARTPGEQQVCECYSNSSFYLAARMAQQLDSIWATYRYKDCLSPSPDFIQY
jgi:hypothetical protein